MTIIESIKQLRADLTASCISVEKLPRTRETSLAIIKIEEATMWLGKELQRLNEPNPYPNSKDASTGDVIDATAKEVSRV